MRPFDKRRHRSGHHKAMRVAVDFLRDVVGLEVVEGPAPAGCFFPGVWFGGGLVLGYDPRVAHVGDLLHDAGHLAVLPESYRRHTAVGSIYTPAMLTPPEEIPVREWIGYFGDREPRPMLLLDEKALELAASAWSLAAIEACDVAWFRVFGVEWVDPHTRAKLPKDAGEVFARSMITREDHPAVRALEELDLTTAAIYPAMSRWLAT